MVSWIIFIRKFTLDLNLQVARHFDKKMIINILNIQKILQKIIDVDMNVFYNSTKLDLEIPYMLGLKNEKI
jgi:hypothetical protein